MTLPETMHGVQLVGHGGLDKLVYRKDLPTPEPGIGEVLIRVAAAGVNNTDRLVFQIRVRGHGYRWGNRVRYGE